MVRKLEERKMKQIVNFKAADFCDELLVQFWCEVVVTALVSFGLTEVFIIFIFYCYDDLCLVA
jgi:hypothetical protein